MAYPIRSVSYTHLIVHPAVTQEIKAIIKEQSSLGTKGVLLDAIALFESGENRLCDLTFAVIAPEAVSYTHLDVYKRQR